ncbi:unnamed protein product [Alternaria alternata]
MEIQVQDAEAARQLSNQDQTETHPALDNQATDERQDDYGHERQTKTKIQDEKDARASESLLHTFEDDKEAITPAHGLGSRDARSQQPMETHNNDTDGPEVIYLCDHLGSRYVFPFEHCSSKEDIEPLWKEIYAETDKSYLDKINEGTYKVENVKGANILPSAWSKLVTPGSTIRIVFVNRSANSPQSGPPLRAHLGDTIEGHGTGGPRVLRTVTFEEPRSVSPSSRSETAATAESDLAGDVFKDDFSGEYSTDYESSESEMSSNEEIPTPEDYIHSSVPRSIATPVDAEGKVLSFQAQIKQPRRSNMLNHDLGIHGEKKAICKSDVETWKITKAMMTEFEGRYVLQIHTLPGPENARLQEGVRTTWYHIQASQLDFERFQDVCLAIPGLSDRLLARTRALLTKVYTEKAKPFLGGRFIEPGTVLRVDDPDGSDSQPVIFSCVPYLSLEPPEKQGSEANKSRFPPHTLMQAMYLYEPVRERDEEQSCKKFSDDRSGNVVHVPNLWMMNIGPGVVVSHGHRPLSSYMDGSINVVQENIKPTSRQDITKNPLTSITITDQGGQTLMFPVGSCRSYFQLEATAYELVNNYMTKAGIPESKFHLRYETLKESTTILPGDWREIVNRAADHVAINIKISEGPEDEKSARDSLNGSTSASAAARSTTSIPPFFHWPDPTRNIVHQGAKKPTALGKPDKKPITYLEQVEAAMLSETLDPLETTDHGVDNAFTSTDYYRSLPERMQMGFGDSLSDLKNRVELAKIPKPGATFHQTVVGNQRIGILEQSIELLNVVQETLKLWVSDLDSACVLRKLSGALDNVREWAVIIDQRGSIEHYFGEYSDTNRKHPATTECAWVLRTGHRPFLLSIPDGNTKLARSMARCKRCQSLKRFSSPQTAFEHLQRHKRFNRVEKPDNTKERGYTTTPGGEHAGVASIPKLQDWVMSPAHFWLEHTNAGTLRILTQACATAREILVEAKEIADGVQNEDGRMSSLYSLPKELVEAFRRIVIFYLAIERALWQTRQIYDDDAQSGKSAHLTFAPYSDAGLEVLERFGNGAKLSLFSARHALKQMAKSDKPLDVLKYLSLGPEYVCAWLMRRLFAKPLEESRTAGDMYRNYVSKVQFEVNHRPSKRLVRSINLIQEELQILISVNRWQSTVIQNYLSVLDDSMYETAIPARRGMFPYERILVQNCLDQLSLAREDYIDLISRCTPLSDRTKQMLEINEEDHGKAIMVFTVVTVIFLPLSFVTSYFGMNASDIRDMDQKQDLFWSVAIPLTVVTVGSCLLIGYNGNELRDMISSFYRKLMGKEKRIIEAYGMGVPQRKRIPKYPSESGGRVDSFNPAYDAEFTSPRFGLQRRPYDFEADDDWYDSPYNPTPLNRLPGPPVFRPMPMTSSDESRYFLENDGLKNKTGVKHRRTNYYDGAYTAPRDQDRMGYDQYRYVRRSSIDNISRNPPSVRSVHIPPPIPPYGFASKKSRSRSRSRNEHGQVGSRDTFFH